MRLALSKARIGIRGGEPFGACIIKDGKVISCDRSAVGRTLDITSHADIVALRKASRKLRTLDLSGCVVYSSCEPCSICFSACNWARISKIFYSARLEDADAFGYPDLFAIPIKTMKEAGTSNIQIVSDFLRKEGIDVLKSWARRAGRKSWVVFASHS